MRKLTYYLGAMLAAVSIMFQSCDDSDTYSIGDIAVDWATVVAKDAHTYSLTGDTWGTLWPAASSIPWYTPTDGQRVIAVFNPLYDDFEGYDCAIKIEGLHRILTKNVEELTEANDSEYGNDPIYIDKRNMWIGGGYLNVVFAQDRPKSEMHRISLVYTSPLTPDAEGYIPLELRYNTYGDTSGYWADGAVSFNLGSVDTESEIKGIKVKINSAVNGDVEASFELKSVLAPKEIQQKDFSLMEVQ